MQEAIHSSLLYLCGTLRTDIERLEQRVKALEAKPSTVPEWPFNGTISEFCAEFGRTTTTAPTPITMTTPNGPTT